MTADDTARLDARLATIGPATDLPPGAALMKRNLSEIRDDLREDLRSARRARVDADAAFIAAAREAVPALIAMVRERDELRDALTARGDAAPAAQPVTMTAEQAAAVFKVEGTHHFHGTRCLCGYESHGRARSATEHITGLTLAALGVEVAE